MRNRAKDVMPNVLLTLLSIIQALALELLWGKLQAAEYLFSGGLITAVYWLQAAVSFLGILVIWIIYATNVMRFRWVPGISDSVLPFFVGLLQFLMIEMLGPGTFGFWFIFLAGIFGMMHGIAQLTMRRARLDGDNSAFFDTVAPATLRDFYWPAATVGGMAAFGIYVQVFAPATPVVLAGVVVVLALLGYQLRGVAYFWNRTMSADTEAPREE